MTITIWRLPISLSTRKMKTLFMPRLRNSEAGTKILARKNRAGDWLQLEWGTPEEPKEGVWGALAVDTDGNLYVADADQHVIVKVVFDDDGKLENLANHWRSNGNVLDLKIVTMFWRPGLINPAVSVLIKQVIFT